MTGASKPSTLTRWTNSVLIGFFATLLWLPTLDTFFHLDWTPPHSEYRAMAVFPKLQPGWNGTQIYLAGLEAYFNDHFGCRKCLVQWRNRLRWSLFKDRNDTHALIGKDGWLFLEDGQMIDHYSGQLQFTPEQLHDWQMLLEKRRDWFARRGIAYLFVVAPNKETIYSEDLPDWVIKIHPQTKLDQFFAYMRVHSTVPVLDLRDVLRDAKHTRPDYLKTDTHWNFFGSFVAYQELVRTLAIQLPGLQPLPLDSFNFTNTLEPGGDLTRILGLSMTESNAWFPVAQPGLPPFTMKMSSTRHSTEPKFSYNTNAQDRAIIFQDSFGLRWSPFLGYHFNQVTYLWQYHLDPAWIERDKPVVVVSEMLERFFDLEDPKKLMAKEALK